MRNFLTVISLCITGLVYSQDNEMIIEPGPPGTLENVIFGDTTPTGERLNPDRIYVLRRGVPYLTNQEIRWGDFDINIKAEEGEGIRPIIIFNAGPGGESIDQMFRLDDGANLTMEGIQLSCLNTIGNFIDRGIRMNGDYGKVVLDDCVIEQTGQSGFRLNADSIRVFVTNTIFNRIGQPNNPDNGRTFDNRGHPIDTLWMENCIAYDVSQRHYRNGSGNLLINGIFNQNTFWGTGLLSFSFGNVENLTFTNNIVANHVFLGETIGADNFAIEIDTFIPEIMNISITNNNFFTDDEFVAAIPTTNWNGDTLVSQRDSLFNLAAQEAVNASARAGVVVREHLEFVNDPPVPVQFITAYAADSTGSGDGIEGAGSWDFSDLTPNAALSQLGTMDPRYTELHDFSYPSSTVSATAGTEGQALGANIAGIISGIPEDFFVRENILYYPNPVKEQLFIQNLDNAKFSHVRIYNLNGQMMMNLPVNQSYAILYLQDLQSGTYILSILDNAGKISSRKIVKH